MVSGLEITCANRDSQGIILRIGGQGWTLPVHEAVVKVISQQLRLNISVDGQLLDVGVRGDGSDAYLAIEPDGYALHDLADLQSC